MASTTQELDLTTRIALTKKKLLNIFSDLKQIYEQSKVALSDPAAVKLFRGMCQSLDRTFHQFKETYELLEELYVIKKEPDTFPTEADERTYMTPAKTYYYESCGAMESIKIAEQQTNSLASNLNSLSLNNTMNEGNQSSRARLPRIELPTFDGTLAQWPLYHSTFSSLVKEDPNIPDVEKYHLLLKSLKGEPLTFVKAIPGLSGDFNRAWTKLVDKHSNKRRLAMLYLDNLVNLKPVSSPPTANGLQEFVSAVRENINSFMAVDIPARYDFILFFLATRRLDKITREAFELENVGVTFPKVETFLEFVNSRQTAMSLAADSSLEVPIPAIKTEATKKFRIKKGTTPKQSSVLLTSTPSTSTVTTKDDSTPKPEHSTPQNCILCPSVHPLKECPIFIKLTPRERLEKLKDFRGCRNCLHYFHRTRNCKSSWTCRQCRRRHHTWLCVDPGQSAISHSPSTNKGSNSTHSITPSSSLNGTVTLPSGSQTITPSSTLTSVTESNQAVLLATAIAGINDFRGTHHPIRLVLDSGGQSSFITQDTVSRLGLPVQPLNIKITGVGSHPVQEIIGKVTCILTSLKGLHKGDSFTTEAIVVPKITSSLPQVTVSLGVRELYTTYELADEEFWLPQNIDFLLGAGLYTKVVLGAPFSIKPGAPDLMQTVFGHVLMGQYAADSTSQFIVSHSVVASEEEVPSRQLLDSVKRFWELEEPMPVRSPPDQYCEDHFKTTHYRTPEGRYVVSLPFHSTPVSLGPSKERSLRQLETLERKLSRDDKLKVAYHEFLSEYEKLNHMTPATTEGEYYIPHHGVMKVTGNQSKLRVVFNGSAKTSKGSLNDHMHPGPKLQADICLVLLNFRRHAIVFCTDIVKMYRQILIHPKDRVFLRILWRHNPSDPITDFELNTVTYGMNSSPYLALRSLQQLIIDEGHNFPLAVPALLTGCYMDDINGGAPTLDLALEIRFQLVELLRRGGFELSKWASNSPDILKAAGAAITEGEVDMASDDQDGVKILGLYWNPRQDCLSYRINPPPVCFTKRGVLSAIARTFDPLGYVAPSVFYAKCIMQKTWKSQSPQTSNSFLGWDDPLPLELENSWRIFLADLRYLAQLQIPRLISHEANSVCHVVGFSDASLKGYGAVLYLVVQTQDHQEAFILKAKTRLAPIKAISIPRLELCGAVLLSRLYSSLEDFLKNYAIQSIIMFTDSSIVLSWLVTNPDVLKTFVSHRISEIQTRTEVHMWRHVISAENPADLLSRGVLPSELVDSHLWWRGPIWLNWPLERWPKSTVGTPFSDLPEIKQTKVSLLAAKAPDPALIDWMEHFSNFSKLVRAMAYILRFIHRFQPTRLGTRVLPPPTVMVSAEEFRQANLHIIKGLQHFYYPEVWQEGKGTEPSLHGRLNTFLDDRGFARVGGRIRHSDGSFARKHPLLLPRRCHYNNVLVDWYHQIHHHAGPATLQAFIQQTYWIPSARSLIKSRKKHCKTCYTLSSKTRPSYMGDLPADRFSMSHPFNITAVDFAGPLLCKTSDRRNAAVVKAYIAVFVCCSTKGLHLELVPSLSTNEFINTLDKFVARRGIPAKILSDCGSNFKGTANYLQEVAQWHNDPLTRDQLIAHSSPKGIEWAFNVPRAPHMGGLWESGVKVTKTLIKRTFGNHSFTYRELDVILAKIEGVLNSRPLYPISDDPNDLEPLTPAHLLIGRALTALPEFPYEQETSNRLSRWEYVRQRTQEFWRRWRTEYLYTLQQRVKWLKRTPNLEVGHLVLIQEDAVPPLQWPLGRILRVFPGRDDIVRVVEVKTSTGTYRRPAVKTVSLSHLQKYADQPLSG